MQDITKLPDAELGKEAVWSILKRVRKICAKFNIAISEADFDAVVIATLHRHGEHLSCHNITQDAPDLVKLTCWTCGELLDRAKAENDEEKGREKGRLVIKATLLTLCEFFRVDTRTKEVPPETQLLIEQLLFQEYFGTPKHGIGMNGLFLAFHCALQTAKSEDFKLPIRPSK
ncbi:MAG: hypothetical protein LBR07_07045 [Puniceicoccales bacterium]|jgi:hypothetical protein|nr:hypothetical protein [Puniceicoccales bacterium]